MSENNYKELIPRLLNDARRGDPKAQYHLGVLYQDGKVVPRDYIQAAKYYTQAAAKGHEKAQLYLGLLYQNGRGIPKNYKQAAFLYSQAAAQGNEKAMYYLGMLHYYGKGTEKNLEEAFKWLTESASRGYPEAKNIIDEILANSRDEIEKKISQDNDSEKENQKTETQNEFVNNNYDVQENHSDNINDIFRRALLENPKEKENDELSEINKINNQVKNKKINKKPKNSKRKFNILIAASTLLLIAAVLFMFFRSSGQDEFSNSKLLTLNSPVETQEDIPKAINAPKKFDKDSEMFDIFSLAENGNLTQLENAVISGADFNQVNDNGETPLHRAAAQNKHIDSVKFLINQGLDVNLETIKGTGYTPLMFAVIHNNIEAVRVLLASGADVKIEIPGNSLMSIAVKNDSPEIVNLLLNSKVSPNIKDDKNKLPLDYANELPSNSLLKNSPVLERLRNATVIENALENDLISENNNVTESINENITNADLNKTRVVQNAARENKIPNYIFKRGKFSFNPYAERIIIMGSGVRFRTEPNTKSRIKTALNKGQILEYYGEWVSPTGERWVLAVSKKNRADDSEFGWIYGQYTQLISPNSEIL